jgi:AraC-like DNA-binding protein
MTQADGVASRSDVAGKWGQLVAERGFAQIPNYLLFLNQFLDHEHRLSPIELLVLIELAAAWWKKSELPFPSMATLAARVGVSERQIQRAVTKLEKTHFLKRVKRRSSGIISSNAYDLAPLVAILENVAKAYPNAFPRRIEVGSSAQFFETPPALELAAPEPVKKRLVLKRAVRLEAAEEAPAPMRVRVPRGIKKRVTAKPDKN